MVPLRKGNNEHDRLGTVVQNLLQSLVLKLCRVFVAHRNEEVQVFGYVEIGFQVEIGVPDRLPYQS